MCPSVPPLFRSLSSRSVQLLRYLPEVKPADRGTHHFPWLALPECRQRQNGGSGNRGSEGWCIGGTALRHNRPASARLSRGCTGGVSGPTESDNGEVVEDH